MSSTKAAASAVAREFLKKARAAAALLDAEGEALHDFRVALRRLVTLMRDFRLCGKDRRRLKKVFDATGAWRDAEVEASWIEAYARRHQEDWALEPLIKELVESRGQLREAALGGLRKRFEAAAEKLARKLARPPAAVDVAALEAYARPVLRRRARKAAKRLLSIKGDADSERLHKARIAVKRLRYSLEPYHWRRAAGLRELQSLLGDLHDRDMIIGTLSAASAGGIADPAALAKAVSAAREERRALFLKVRRQWLDRRVKELRNIV